MSGEGEIRAEEIYAITIWARAETGIKHVVGAGHAFDYVSGEVSVRARSRDVDRSTGV